MADPHRATIPVHLPFEAPWESDPVEVGQVLLDVLCRFAPVAAGRRPSAAAKAGEPGGAGPSMVRPLEDGASVEVDAELLEPLTEDGHSGIYRAGGVVLVHRAAAAPAPERLCAVGRLHLDAYAEPTSGEDDGPGWDALVAGIRWISDDGTVVTVLDRLDHPSFDPGSRDPEFGSFVLDLRPQQGDPGLVG